MARLSTFFTYQSGSSRIHDLDVRFKFLALGILSIAVLQYNAIPLTSISLLSIILVRYIGLSPFSILVELRYFILLLALIILARAFTTPGTSLLHLPWLPMTRDGLIEGGITAWRILLVAVFGLIFIATTKPAAVKAGVVFYLKPIPMVPAARIGTMLGLILRFIPLIFRQAEATLDAQRARGIELRRNPFYRIKSFALPFMRRLFMATDRLIEAMEARCYSDQRTDPVLISQRSDWWMLLCVIGVAGLLSFM
jgi:energy-coupling factor transporter transmembrane protein EcfT